MADVDPSYVGRLPAGSQSVPSPPAWAWKVRREVGWAGLLAALVIGLLADQALRVGAFGLAASATFITGAAVLLFIGRLRRPQPAGLLVAAAIFAVWFTVRASAWLLWPDLVAALLLLGLAVSFAVRGSLFELSVSELALRFFQVSVQAVVGGAYIAKPLLASRSRLATLAPLLRGLLIALPIAALLALLLAQADPVFASFFKLNIDLGQLVLDVIFVASGVLSFAGALRAAASVAIPSVQAPGWRLGATEALVVVAVLDGLFAAFAVAQVLAATGAAAETLRAVGVTYSDYARSGFFQLLWVSGITLCLLFVFGRITGFRERTSRLAFVALAEVAIALTLMIDVVAFRRLSLYEDVYGFTMLRLYSHVFAGWVALVFAMLAADLAGVFSPRSWFIGATITSAALLLLALNVANPEAMVVTLNFDHEQATHKLDVSYFLELSSDATPAMLSPTSQLDPLQQKEVNTIVACRGSRAYSAPLAAFNWSDAQATAARHQRC